MEKMIRREDDIVGRKEDSDSTNKFSKEEKDYNHMMFWRSPTSEQVVSCID